MFPDLQSAYRQGHSTETALLKIFSDILDAADSAQVTLLGLLDLSAAFDTVDHDSLLTRLQVSYGVSGSALAWIASFILHRSQSVNFNGQSSARLQMRYGVPQGSVLGPLLSILYTALGPTRTPTTANSTYTAPPPTQSTAVMRLAECIESVERWMRSNRLKLNSDKTQFMWLGSKQQLAKIETESMQIGEHCIKFSTSAKNLGVTFDPELKMDLHVNNMTRSCFFQLRQLRSIRRSLTMEATKTLVQSLVSSRVDYCNSIFYGAKNAVLRRLQSVLNAAARLVTNTRKFDHITPVLRDQLHWLPIRQRIIFKNCNLRSEFTAWSWPDISQSIPASPISVIGGTSPPSFCGTGTPHHTSNQDTSLRAKKLPCLRTDCVELPTRRHCKSWTVTGTFQDWIENSSISFGIRLSSAHSAYVTWLRGA